jgi:hypothetical protein
VTATRARTFERLAALYFGGHAVLDALWWIAVKTSPSFRGWFDLDPDHDRVLDSFLFADLVLLGAVSAFAAVAIVRHWRSARALAAVTAGASAYATLYIIGWVLLGGHGWMGAVAMSIETAIMVVLVALM